MIQLLFMTRREGLSFFSRKVIEKSLGRSPLKETIDYVKFSTVFVLLLRVACHVSAYERNANFMRTVRKQGNMPRRALFKCKQI